jgi:hypothetical protein
MIYFPNYIELNYQGASSFIYYLLIFGVLLGNIIGGVAANYIGVRQVYSWGTLISIALIVPVIIAIKHTDIDMFSMDIMTVLFAAAQGVFAVLSLMLLANRFPVTYRYTALASTYALSALCFIGIPPFLFSYFTREVSMYYPMLVLGIGYTVQLIAVQFFYNKTEQFVSA